MTTQQVITPNPWLTAWNRPRETIRKIIQVDPKYQFAGLVCLIGIAYALSSASRRNLGDTISLEMILLLSVITGIIRGYVTIYLWAFIVKVTGRWLGGKASPQQLRAAFAWAHVPIIWALLLWIPELLLFGEDIFKKDIPILISTPSLRGPFIEFVILEIGIAAWTLVLLVNMLAEVQQFSRLRAVLNLLAPLFIAIAFFITLAVLFFAAKYTL